MFRDRTAPGVDYGLTRREVEILQLLVDGHKLKQIAEQLYRSRHTIDSQYLREAARRLPRSRRCQGGGGT